jgi:DNA-binding NarL/FixJ family response regulator
MRAGLRAVLSSDETIEVVGEAGDGRAAIHEARVRSPDVVLMDVRISTRLLPATRSSPLR